MALRDRFLKKIRTGQEYILICSSTNHMLKAEKLIRSSGINVEMIPTPQGLGSACTTALLFDSKDKVQVEKLIERHDVAYEGIYPLIKKDRREAWQEVFVYSISESVLSILEKVAVDEVLSKEEIITLLSIESEEEKAALFKAADLMREECVGPKVDIRGAIEFSNYCIRSCNYCGLRKENRKLHRYRMTIDEILAVAYRMKEMGIKTVILQSGEDPFYTVELIEEIIKTIKAELGMRITLSLGERSYEEYRRFKEAGANNYLLKIEAANQKLFYKAHPDGDWEKRAKHTRWLKELGYIVGSGNIIGLPGQTVEDIAEDILFFKKYGIHMIGIGPFIPAANSPWANLNPGTVDMTLKTLAVTRLVCQNVYIPATTALATLSKEGFIKALRAGTNTIMLIMTPPIYREKYQIYSNKNMVNLDFAVECIEKAQRELPSYIKV
ncbi:[FeFe] hydrogenase H-cluster radical SAM maturase HydE [Anoxybacter fermentans]|uniref:[FeFe] hydrogenase H-cluster radical SAM maturase HydE n=1 Tax=Anoxybacter fermentans TaxID=1323375 RepID=A0A3S9SZ49_9FIRM|nr:[FeFe] hydrogenase H-cluster radical SAM maturase HydE [Anoxybacter fermentans]AZR73528.1 [FeFe] hydrogenase H-cluster radical SAM maturase HydE [Anoxybacter fermentans]